MKYKLFVVALCLSSSPVMAQNDKAEVTVSADVVSQYIWRGYDLGNAAVQPTLGLEWKGLSLSAWGSVGIASASDTKEFDLTLAYSAGGFNIGITDYWFSEGQDPDGRYFQYAAHRTNHIFEGNIGYDFGALNVQWYTNFSGNDGVGKSGKRAYSSYFELSAPFRLGQCDWTATLGGSPYASSMYETNGFAITNIGMSATKEIFGNDRLSIPVFAGITANPCLQKAYFTFGFSIQPK